ncbi:MAG: SusC/RagA family TonB-linked outer membrane protein, partial [Brumimicrobium sp.]
SEVLENDVIQETVTGTVVDAQSGEPLPGVNIVVKGTSSGTSTNMDGFYELDNVSSLQDTLVFTFVGFDTQEIPINGRDEIDVELEASAVLGGELVVTAFGLEREKKGLGYATQQVKSEEILDSRQVNIVNTLQGKMAGVQVTNSSGSPGASSMILIRGGTSLTSNNQPLFVVDGIPIDNSSASSVAGNTATSGVNAPGANRAIDINPEDIESVSVLKGPSAAALYGQRAGSGAVIITTKRGAEGSAVINYSNTFSFDWVNNVPSLQSRFKQGERGEFNINASDSWGPEFEPGDEIFDNVDNFFGRGFTQNHNLSVSGGTSQSRFFGSASLMDQGGIVQDNNDFNRNSFRFTADTRAAENLRIEGSVSYTESDRSFLEQGQNGLMGALFWPRNDDMRDYLNPDGTQRTIISTDNPFWGSKNKPFNSEVSRTMFIGSVFYDPFDFLNITYRIGTDRFSDNRRNYEAVGAALNQGGIINESETDNQLTTSTLLITARKTFAESFNTSLRLGNNLEYDKRQTISQTGENFIGSDFISINNVVEQDRRTSSNARQRRLVGAFVDLNMDWKDIIFVNFRGRNDWSSTLPSEARSFFYPSVNTSLVVTELMNELGYNIKSSVLSYVELRGSWARVGKDAPPHILNNTLATATNTFTIAPQGFISNVNDFFGNPNLKPEFTNSTEVGADIRFLDERLGLDFTYYKTTTDEQILGTRTPPSSSSFLAFLNGGSIQNEGVEFLLNAHPVRNEKFDWRFDVNISKNNASVLDLPGTLDRVELSDATTAFGVAQGSAFLNGPLFGINGQVWKQNDAGELLLDNQGFPQVDAIRKNIGNREPDWIGGITNSLRYRDFGLTFTWDIRLGGDIFNATEIALVRSGLSTNTLNRGETKVFDGIIESSGERNDQEVILDQDFFQTLYAENAENFVEDGTWYRLRYVTLNYRLPQQSLVNLPINNLDFFVTGRNLLL